MKGFGFILFSLFAVFVVAQSTLDTKNQLKNYLRAYNNSPVKKIIAIDSLLIKKNENLEAKAYLFYAKGVTYLNYLGDFAEAKEALNEALELYTTLNSPKNVINTQMEIANSYLYEGKQAKSIELLRDIEERASQLKLDNVLARCYMILSRIYYLNNDFDSSFKYIRKSNEIYKLDSLNLSANYNNMAILHRNMNRLDSALYYNYRSLEINKELNDLPSVAKSYNNIGNTYKDFGQLDSALFYMNNAVEINEQNNILNSSPYENIADIYSLQKNYPYQAIYLLKALDVHQKSNDIKGMSKIYHLLALNAMNQEQYKNGIKYQTKLDSVAQIQNRQRNNERLLMLNNQRKFLENKAKLAEIKQINQTNKILLWAGGIGLIFLVIFGVQQYRNVVLKNKNEKFILEQKALRAQMNPHFIFNTLSAIQNTLLDNEPLKSADYLSRFASLIRIYFDFAQKDKISIEEDLEALESYIKTQQMRFEDAFSYEIHVAEDMDIAEIEIPPLLLQPLVENAIEHGFKNIDYPGKLEIWIEGSQYNQRFTIRDNGAGYMPQFKKKEHALDIFVKRLRLRNKRDGKSFIIRNLGPNEKGTEVKFQLSS